MEYRYKSSKYLLTLQPRSKRFRNSKVCDTNAGTAVTVARPRKVRCRQYYTIQNACRWVDDRWLLCYMLAVTVCTSHPGADILPASHPPSAKDIWQRCKALQWWSWPAGLIGKAKIKYVYIWICISKAFPTFSSYWSVCQHFIKATIYTSRQLNIIQSSHHALPFSWYGLMREVTTAVCLYM